MKGALTMPIEVKMSRSRTFKVPVKVVDTH